MLSRTLLQKKSTIYVPITFCLLNGIGYSQRNSYQSFLSLAVAFIVSSWANLDSPRFLGNPIFLTPGHTTKEVLHFDDLKVIGMLHGLPLKMILQC